MNFELNTANNPEYITAVTMGTTYEHLEGLCQDMATFFENEQKSHPDKPTDVCEAFNKWVKSNPECLKDYDINNPMHMFRLGFAFDAVMQSLVNPFERLFGK